MLVRWTARRPKAASSPLSLSYLVLCHIFDKDVQPAKKYGFGFPVHPPPPPNPIALPRRSLPRFLAPAASSKGQSNRSLINAPPPLLPSFFNPVRF